MEVERCSTPDAVIAHRSFATVLSETLTDRALDTGVLLLPSAPRQPDGSSGAGEDRIPVSSVFPVHGSRASAGLHREGFKVAIVHGALPTAVCRQMFERWASGQCNITCTTDVLARGTDYLVDLVINFDCPKDAVSYLAHHLCRLPQYLRAARGSSGPTSGSATAPPSPPAPCDAVRMPVGTTVVAITTTTTTQHTRCLRVFGQQGIVSLASSSPSGVGSSPPFSFTGSIL